MKLRGVTLLLALQTLILFVGAVVAWSSALSQIVDFLARYGTLLRFDELLIPNPLLTSCLYGSIAFLIVLFWSTLVLGRPSYLSERNLRNLLLFCVAFAASVVSMEAAAYYHVIGAVSFTCSPGIAPTATPCFRGLLAFGAAFLAAILAARRLESPIE
ncbi:hypothetical protein KGM48_03700 [Patescibacteria group bacterium]|nr:hypothetical protein [Patescibacteria group bacterium]